MPRYPMPGEAKPILHSMSYSLVEAAPREMAPSITCHMSSTDIHLKLISYTLEYVTKVLTLLCKMSQCILKLVFSLVEDLWNAFLRI